MIEALVAPLPEGSARRAFHLLAWTEALVGGAEAIHRGEELLELAQDSLAAGWPTCLSLWDGGELGRAGDVLAGIDARAGEELVLLRVKRARMWRQQGLHRRSREALEKVIGRWPDRRSAYAELVELFQAEGWLEDRCAVLEEVMRRWPEWGWGRLERASCLVALGRQREAEAIYDLMLDVRPVDAWTVGTMVSRVTEDGRLDEAARRLRDHLESRPDSVWALNRLAELERRLGRNADAERTFQRALAIDPDNAWIWSRLASLAYQQGDRKLAIERWQAALARSPADQQLSNRLAYLVPPAEGDPAADVPEEPALDAAVKAAREARALPGADEIVALDDEVRVLHADGSSMSVITSVRRAITQAGLDAVRDQRLGGGKTRVLAAYAVDAKGRRTEPSTLRAGQVIFRGLQVGSTVVLQYRVDTYPRQVLGRSFEGWWWFESFRRQITAARFVLWRPSEMPFREKTPGEVRLQRDERRVGELVRVAWTARDTPPIIPEESMPGAVETLTHVRYTTVPDWETFTRWEAALLDEALRPSDDVDRLARTLDPDAPVVARLERIHAYVMKEVRYQQDYENPLARWMPHPTSMVLERRYGDCKDKANLFLMLARATGIDARFALIRTREQGAVDPDLPGLQFNHAIVYVPAQPGLPQARFFDPTADELDLDALPAMDQGTLSLVYDPATRTNEWVPVPFQPPTAGERRAHARLVLSEDGSARAHLAYSVNGGEGSTLRRTARNEEQMRQLVSAIAGWLYSGAEVTESRTSGLDDLRARAGVEMEVGIPGAARLEAGELRLPVPGNLAVVPVPSLPQRRFPMVWNVPSATVWSVDVEAPPGWTVRSLPPPLDASSACIDLSRRSTRSGRSTVHVEVRLTFRCERIGAADYAATRRFLDEARRTLQDPVILARARR